MELNYIIEFALLAKKRNYSEAADALFTTQSTLSKHIKFIENELGTTLFERTTRKVELNDYGKAFLKYAEQIARIKDAYSTELEAMIKNAKGSVSVGSIPSMAQYNITDVVYRFMKDNLSFELDLIEGDSLELRTKLVSGEVELAFLIEKDVSDLSLERILYTKDVLTAVVPIGHRLAKKNQISLGDLKGEDLVLFANNTLLYRICKQQCEEAGFEMQVLFTGHNIDNIADFIVKGKGIALLLRGQTRFIRNPHTTLVDITPEFDMDINLCWNKGRKLSSGASHFIRCVKYCIENETPRDAIPSPVS